MFYFTSRARAFPPETRRTKGVVELYMVVPVDECCVQQLKEFVGKKPKSPTRKASTWRTCT